MSVMTVGVADSTRMVSLQLWVLPNPIEMLGILFRWFDTIIVWRVVLLVASSPASYCLNLYLACSFPTLVCFWGQVG